MTNGAWNLALAAFIAAYLAFLLVFGSGAAVGSDASGYLNAARMLASGDLSTPLRRVPGAPERSVSDRDLMPLGLALGRAPGTLVPKYPVGLPLHLAVASRVVGWAMAGPVVNAVAAVAALLLLFGLGRRLGLPPAWALASGLFCRQCLR